MLRLAVLSITVLLLFAVSETGKAQEISGLATDMIDGDTFDINGLRFRQCGIDAPEHHQPDGEPSRLALGALLAGVQVTCQVVGGGTVCNTRSRTMSRERVVAQCFVDVQDVAASIVEAGQACDWPDYSGGHYSLANCVRE